MLGAGEEVAPDEWGVGHVGAVLDAGVGQRRIAPPVLGRAVAEHDPRRVGPLGDPVEEPGPPIGGRVRLGEVGEGEQVAEARRRLDRRLGVAVVELPPPAPTHQPEHPVERPPSLLVDVESQVEEVAEEPAVLGDPGDDQPVGPAPDRVVRPVGAEEGRQVAGGHQPGPDDRSVADPVDQVVDPPGLQPIVDPQLGPVGERPAVAGERRRLVGQPVPDPQDGLGVGWVGRGDRLMATERPDVLVGQRDRGDGLRQLEPELHPARLGSRDPGHVESDPGRAAGDVPLPADPGQGEALVHQEAVTGIDPGRRRRCRGGPVEQPGHPPVASVGDVEQRDPVGPVGIDGPQHRGVTGEPDRAVVGPLGVGQVDDVQVGRMLGIDGVGHREIEPLVCPDAAERAPALVGGACLADDLDHGHGPAPFASPTFDDGPIVGRRRRRRTAGWRCWSIDGDPAPPSFPPVR